MKKNKWVLFFSLVLLIFIGYYSNFYLHAKVVDSSNEPFFISVTRSFINNYNKGDFLNVSLIIDVNESFLVDGEIFLAEIITGGKIDFVNSENLSYYFENDSISFNNLSFEDQEISYSIVGESNSPSFNGKWGFEFEQGVNLDCIFCQGDIIGQSSPSSFIESILDFFNSGRGGSSRSSSSSITSTSDVDPTSFFDQENDSSLDSNLSLQNEKKQSTTGNGIWFFILACFVLLILGIVFYMFKKKRKKKLPDLN